MIDRDDQTRLLQLARQALEARVRKMMPPDIEKGGAFDLKCGAFVTIYCRGELRGCLGRVDVETPLAETIIHLAAVVSDSDPRFDPVLLRDLWDITLEISVLTPEREIQSIEEIEIGTHGVVIEQGHRRGLLLPQVATEHRWDRTTFLKHVCQKAFLPPDAWTRGARILIFEAQVFAEAPKTEE